MQVHLHLCACECEAGGWGETEVFLALLSFYFYLDFKNILLHYLFTYLFIMTVYTSTVLCTTCWKQFSSSPCGWFHPLCYTVGSICFRFVWFCFESSKETLKAKWQWDQATWVRQYSKTSLPLFFFKEGLSGPETSLSARLAEQQAPGIYLPLCCGAPPPSAEITGANVPGFLWVTLFRSSSDILLTTPSP